VVVLAEMASVSRCLGLGVRHRLLRASTLQFRRRRRGLPYTVCERKVIFRPPFPVSPLPASGVDLEAVYKAVDMGSEVQGLTSVEQSRLAPTGRPPTGSGYSRSRLLAVPLGEPFLSLRALLLPIFICYGLANLTISCRQSCSVTVTVPVLYTKL
jgi:hypothetical protein